MCVSKKMTSSEEINEFLRLFFSLAAFFLPEKEHVWRYPPLPPPPPQAPQSLCCVVQVEAAGERKPGDLSLKKIVFHPAVLLLPHFFLSGGGGVRNVLGRASATGAFWAMHPRRCSFVAGKPAKLFLQQRRSRRRTTNRRSSFPLSHPLLSRSLSFPHSLSQGSASATGKLHKMHVTACLAGQDEVEVEVGEECRTLQALKEAIAVALPQLCVEGFDVSVGGRGLDDDNGVVSLSEGVCLDVVPNTRGLSVLALREAGREVSEDGLLKAAHRGYVSQCTLYLDAGVPIDCVDASSDQTPLHLSCDHGHLATARLLLDRGSTAIDEKDRHGYTPLHYACWEGSLETASLLLDRGSTAIDENDCHGNTPLHLSCRRGNLETAGLLLDRGSTAIDENNGDCETPLHVSCRCGHLETARLLLDRGSTAIDKTDGNGYTPLHFSCYHGQLETARLLLDRGSTAIDEKDGRGLTPLHLSCVRGHLETARLLLDRGSTAIDEKDDIGDTPLHISCFRGHWETARLLLDRGSTAIDEKNRFGETPLHQSCAIQGHLETSKLRLFC